MPSSATEAARNLRGNRRARTLASQKGFFLFIELPQVGCNVAPRVPFIRGLDPRIHQYSREAFLRRLWIAGSSPAMTSSRGEAPLILQPHPEHHHRRRRTRSDNVGVQNIPAQAALDPEIAGHLVNQVALERIDF